MFFVIKRYYFSGVNGIMYVRVLYALLREFLVLKWIVDPLFG